MNTRTVDDYLALPYTIEVFRDDSEDDPGWVARVVELPGCITQADTFAELGEMVEDAMRAWVEVALEESIPVPEPRPIDDYSGKFVTRVPRSLHRQLVDSAEREGVSLNAFVNVALARAVGQEPARAAAAAGEMTFAPRWSHLSKAAFRAMIAAGLEVEAQDVNERLFGGWLEKNLAQVRAAAHSGYFKDALAHLEEVQQALSLPRNASPLMEVFFQAIAMLRSEMEEAVKLRQGIVARATVQARIHSELQQTTQHDIEQYFYKEPTAPGRDGNRILRERAVNIYNLIERDE